MINFLQNSDEMNLQPIHGLNPWTQSMDSIHGLNAWSYHP